MNEFFANEIESKSLLAHIFDVQLNDRTSNSTKNLLSDMQLLNITLKPT